MKSDNKQLTNRAGRPLYVWHCFLESSTAIRPDCWFTKELVVQNRPKWSTRSDAMKEPLRGGAVRANCRGNGQSGNPSRDGFEENEVIVSQMNQAKVRLHHERINLHGRFLPTKKHQARSAAWPRLCLRRVSPKVDARLQ